MDAAQKRMADAIMDEIESAQDGRYPVQRDAIERMIYDYWPDQPDYLTLEDAVAEVADMVREAEAAWNRMSDTPIAISLASAADELRDRAMRLGELSGMRKVLAALRSQR